MVSRNIKLVSTRSASVTPCVPWHSTLKNVAFGKHKNIVDQVALSFYCDGCGELFKYNNCFWRHEVNACQGCGGSSVRNVVNYLNIMMISEDIKSVFIRMSCSSIVKQLVNDSERMTISEDMTIVLIRVLWCSTETMWWMFQSEWQI